MAITLPSSILQTVQHGLLNKYFIVSAATILVYDYVLMLPAEVEHIWMAKWSVGSVLYILTRYMAFIEVPFIMLYAFNTNIGLSPNAATFCVHTYKADAWLDFGGITVALNILYLRTAAIWGWSKTAKVGVILANCIIVPISAYSLVAGTSSVTFVPTPFPKLFPCNLEFGKNTSYIDFAMVLVVESCIIALTVCRRLRAWPKKPTPLLRTLYRDALVYFCCLCAVSTVNLILYKAPSLKDFYELLVEMQHVLHSVSTARIILHLRIVSSRPGSNDGSVMLSSDYMKKMAIADTQSFYSDYSGTSSDAPSFEMRRRGPSHDYGPRAGRNSQIVVNPYMI